MIAVHTMFGNHPDVGICHPDQTVENWEPVFWNFAATALENTTLAEDVSFSPFEQFKQRMAISAPGLRIESPLTGKMKEANLAIAHLEVRRGEILSELTCQ